MQHGCTAEKNKGFQRNSWECQQNPFPETKKQNLLIAYCKHFFQFMLLFKFSVLNTETMSSKAIK